MELSPLPRGLIRFAHLEERRAWASRISLTVSHGRSLKGPVGAVDDGGGGRPGGDPVSLEVACQFPGDGLTGRRRPLVDYTMRFLIVGAAGTL